MNNPAGRRKIFSTFLDVSENDPAGGGKNLAIFEIFQVYFHFLKYVQTFEHPKFFSRLPAREDVISTMKILFFLLSFFIIAACVRYKKFSYFHFLL